MDLNLKLIEFLILLYHRIEVNIKYEYTTNNSNKIKTEILI